MFKLELTFLLSIKTEDDDDDFETIVSSKLIEVLSTIMDGISGITTSGEDSSPPQLTIKNMRINFIKRFFITFQFYFLKLFLDSSNTYSITSLCLLSNLALLPDAGDPYTLLDATLIFLTSSQCIRK